MNAAFSPSTRPWIMLVARLAIFAVIQALMAVLLRVFGVSDAWSESARWWLFSVIAANLITILLLVRFMRDEGRRYLDLLLVDRKGIWLDLALTLGIFLLAMPLGLFPGRLLAEALFQSPDTPAAMMFQPLPPWAVLVGILFPLTIAFSELPTYFGYSMPRLARQLGNPWLAWALASLFLSLQHMTLPLILDARFILWRALMFLPFALFLGLAIKLRPGLLPYLVVCHFLVDLAALGTYLTV